MTDGAAWLVGTVLAVTLRLEFTLSPRGWIVTLVLGIGAGILQIVVGYGLALYRGRFPLGSFEEVRSLAPVVAGLALALSGIVIPLGNAVHVPRGTVLLAAPLVLVLMLAVRYLARLVLDKARKPGRDAEPAIIIGAGHMGDRFLYTVLTDPAAPIRPVALLDDDPAKHLLHLRGVPVRGRVSDLDEVARHTGATVLVIAIGGADSALLRDLTDRGERAGLRVVVTPSLTDLMLGGTSRVDARDIRIEDLIGRHPVDTNVELIAGYITGKRVLVTGAGGSIGSELCRQLSRFGPSELIMLDRDETGLQNAQLGTAGHGLLDSNEVVLADIRDGRLLNEIFDARRPEVVFHAAALKHLPMLEQYPDEAWKTNVIGTRNVLDAALRSGVTNFVNVSTDKAANPTSVLGHSKRLAEKLTAWAGERSGQRYLSVRFGNVLGSRGSMLPTFQALIAAGGPITVTHPEATRYFMTIAEACQLVIQAGGIGRAGEVLILDMDEPVSILEIAKRMISMSGKQIDIVFTGLRPGEKLHEELAGADESLARPFHPKISHAHAEALAPDRLDREEWVARMSSTPREDNSAAVERIGVGNGE
ncbi:MULTISPECIES: polysaccharide biosynthesis protein [Bacteria]|uniref:polysaccharide biosynthesis protein n=1 Tax=Bacteria TaxID=2 RepID=UPI003C7B2299